MGVSSAFCTSEKRTNLCQRHRESTSHHMLYALWIAMTLVSLTKGIVFKSGIPRYRCIYQVSPCFVRPQTALCSVARTPPNALPSSTGASESPSTAEETRIRKPWKTLFDLELPEGRCLGLRIDAAQSQQSDALSANTIACEEHWIHSSLHQEEVQYAAAQPSEYTQQTFLLGRLAMRQVLKEEYASPILKDAHGRPIVPPNYLGSISHKRSVADGMTAVALVSPYVEGMGVGVDIELAFPGRKSIAKRVLTPNEIMELGRIEGVSKDEEVLLRFSLKEAFYKAIHPLICQYVGFQEAEVTPHQDGTATVRWNLKSGAHKRFQSVLGHWRRVDEFFLSSASVRICGDQQDECVMGVAESQ